MATIRSSSNVSLTDDGDHAWRSNSLSPRLREILGQLRSSPDRRAVVREMMALLGDSSHITEDLSELARSGWVIIQNDRPSSSLAELPVEEAAPDEALSSLLTRRPAPPFSEQAPTPGSPAPAGNLLDRPTEPPTEAASDERIMRTAIEVRSDPDRDRRLLEAMGILKAKPTESEPPPKPHRSSSEKSESGKSSQHGSSKDSHSRIPLSSKDLLARISSQPKDD